jgi:hypothetical protein
MDLTDEIHMIRILFIISSYQLYIFIVKKYHEKISQDRI